MAVKFYTKGLATYMRKAPSKILDLISAIPKEGKGTLRGKNVVLVHPSLGKCSENLIHLLYSNQLDWIAREWAGLCKQRHKVFGDAMEVGSLFIDGREWGSFMINSKGKITEIK